MVGHDKSQYVLSGEAANVVKCRETKRVKKKVSREMARAMI